MSPSSDLKTEPMGDEDVAHLRAQLALGRSARRGVGGMGLGCVGIGLAVGAILLSTGELLGGVIFPVLLVPTGGLFLWLATRAKRTIERDLADRQVAVLEGIVQAKQKMQLPRGAAHSVRMEGRDVFVNATTFELLSPGDRIRIRRAPHSGIALSTLRFGPDGEAAPLTDAKPSEDGEG